jgi:hypothetical protein
MPAGGRTLADYMAETGLDATDAICDLLWPRTCASTR